MNKTILAAFVAIAALTGCQKSGSGAAREVHVDVTANGFEPAEVRVPAGKTATLVITRTTDQTCAKEVVFPSLNQRVPLPLHQPVRVALPAGPRGTLTYRCGMDMLGGTVVVE